MELISNWWPSLFYLYPIKFQLTLVNVFTDNAQFVWSWHIAVPWLSYAINTKVSNSNTMLTDKVAWGEEVTEGHTTWQNEEIRDLYSSSNIISAIKWSWTRKALSMHGGEENLVEKPMKYNSNCNKSYCFLETEAFLTSAATEHLLQSTLLCIYF